MQLFRLAQEIEKPVHPHPREQTRALKALLIIPPAASRSKSTFVNVPSCFTSALCEGSIDDSRKSIRRPQKRICQVPMSFDTPGGFTQ